MEIEIGGESRLGNKTILIIGSGPAGTAAAIWAAKFGFRVTIVESARFPRNRPGETLHPGVEPLFDQLGVNEDVQAAKFMRHKGIWIRWSKNNNDNNHNNNSIAGNVQTSDTDGWDLLAFGRDEKGPWLGYQAWRATLDNILLKRAKRCSVSVLQPCYALDVILDHDRRKVIGLKTSAGNFMADFVIDATGGIHWLARRFRLTIEKYSQPLIAYYGYVKGECPWPREEPAITLTPEGWTWTAKIQKHLYQWTRVYYCHNHNNDSYNKFILRYGCTPDEFKELKPYACF